MAVKRQTESKGSKNNKKIAEITGYVDWDGSTPVAGGKRVRIHPLAKTIKDIKAYAKAETLTKTQEKELIDYARKQLATSVPAQKVANAAEAKGKPSSVDIAAKGTVIDALLDGIKNQLYTPAEAAVILKKRQKLAKRMKHL